MPEFTKNLQDQFCELLTKTGNVSHAAESVGISRASVYRYRNDDPHFREAWDNAYMAFMDDLESEAMKRATGYKEPIVYQGQIMYETGADGKPLTDAQGKKIPLTVTRASDRLLLFLLESRHPEYRHRFNRGQGEFPQLPGPGASGKFPAIDVSNLDSEDQRVLFKLLERCEPVPS